MKTTLLIATLLAAPHCRADVLFTTVTSTDQNGTLKPMMTLTTALKDGFERLDSTQEMGLFRSGETTISNRAKREKITLDSGLKIYIAEPLEAANNGSPAEGKSKTGTRILTLGAKFLGLESLMNRSVRHYSLSTATDSSGCCGTFKNVLKSEVWMADVEVPAFDAGVLAAEHPGCRVDVQRRGDIEGYEAAQKGLAFKTLIFDEAGKMVMNSQVTALSLAPLSDDLFVIPKGFKKVSRAAYDRARVGAMMAAMQASRK